LAAVFAYLAARPGSDLAQELACDLVQANEFQRDLSWMIWEKRPLKRCSSSNVSLQMWVLILFQAIFCHHERRQVKPIDQYRRAEHRKLKKKMKVKSG
jgi:hypothetical protein